MTPKQTWRLLSETYKEWNQDKVPRLAAALAYYTVFSIAPLLLIIIAIAGFFFGEAAIQDQISTQLQGLMGESSAETIESILANTQQASSGKGFLASVTGLVALILGASGVFVQLQDALNAVWNVEAKPEKGLWGLLRKRFLSFSMILVIVFLLLVSLVASTGITAMSSLLNSWLPELDIIVRAISQLPLVKTGPRGCEKRQNLV